MTDLEKQRHPHGIKKKQFWNISSLMEILPRFDASVRHYLSIITLVMWVKVRTVRVEPLCLPDETEQLLI